MELFTTSYFVLFLIIVIGFIIGRIKIKGISLDISAVIFVALVFGHYWMVVPSDFQNLGLVLFIFTEASKFSSIITKDLYKYFIL